MKLFIWNDGYKQDYSTGIGIALAENVEQARELLRAENKCSFQRFSDVDCEPSKVLEIDQPCIVCDEYGGS